MAKRAATLSMAQSTRQEMALFRSNVTVASNVVQPLADNSSAAMGEAVPKKKIKVTPAKRRLLENDVSAIMFRSSAGQSGTSLREPPPLRTATELIDQPLHCTSNLMGLREAVYVDDKQDLLHREEDQAAAVKMLGKNLEALNELKVDKALLQLFMSSFDLKERGGDKSSRLRMALAADKAIVFREAWDILHRMKPSGQWKLKLRTSISLPPVFHSAERQKLGIFVCAWMIRRGMLQEAGGIKVQAKAGRRIPAWA